MVMKKSIEVVAALIRRDDKLFATERGYGPWKDWWEFPGGKMEPGEAPEEALKREIREELDAGIEVGRLLRTIDRDNPEFHLTMHCYLCALTSAGVHLNEHEAARWLDYTQLREVRWLPSWRRRSFPVMPTSTRRTARTTPGAWCSGRCRWRRSTP